MGKAIFYIDVNSAYLSWEAVYRLKHLNAKTDLREQAAAMAGDAAMRHGIILAKSLSAKRYGIKTGQSILEAQTVFTRCRAVQYRRSVYQYERNRETCGSLFQQIVGQDGF